MKSCLLLALALSSILAGCDTSVILNNAPLETHFETGVFVTGFKTFVTYEGKSRYIIESRKAQMIEKENYVELEDINLSFHKEDSGEIAGTLVADEGVYFIRDNPVLDHGANDVELRGNVVFETVDGTLLKTSEVRYNDATETISSDSDFEKRKVGKDHTLVIKGKSFVTDKAMRQWEDVGATMTFESHSNANSKER